MAASRPNRRPLVSRPPHRCHGRDRFWHAANHSQGSITGRFVGSAPACPWAMLTSFGGAPVDDGDEDCPRERASSLIATNPRCTPASQRLQSPRPVQTSETPPLPSLTTTSSPSPDKSNLAAARHPLDIGRSSDPRRKSSRWLGITTRPPHAASTTSSLFPFIYHNDVEASRHREFKRRFSSVQSTMTRPHVTRVFLVNGRGIFAFRLALPRHCTHSPRTNKTPRLFNNAPSCILRFFSGAAPAMDPSTPSASHSRFFVRTYLRNSLDLFTPRFRLMSPNPIRCPESVRTKFVFVPANRSAGSSRHLSCLPRLLPLPNKQRRCCIRKSPPRGPSTAAGCLSPPAKIGAVAVLPSIAAAPRASQNLNLLPGLPSASVCANYICKKGRTCVDRLGVVPGQTCSEPNAHHVYPDRQLQSFRALLAQGPPPEPYLIRDILPSIPPWVQPRTRR
ncbi:hypothetical protein CKAH01_17065 [Colletotrichum kahawae]|uniref:Uncharacterized protein n=1 Tax=Colletotrichum kahawae TaxID=34407 RepID=A0AAE0D5Q8_COLKA|nr:hypothetical protein CKAH01_17065 [Colletotrichum kahawae]